MTGSTARGSTTERYGRSVPMARVGPTRVFIACSLKKSGAICLGTPRHSRAKSYDCRGTNETQEGHMVTNLPTGHTQRVTEFLQKQTARGRIAFVIDATMSREPTWDAASQLSSEMLSEAAKLGNLEMM